MVGCGNDSGTDADKGKSAAAPAKTAEVVIYTNADEEAQTAMKNALDKNGMKGAYLIQSFGTSELGGKLAAEGKNIEADVVTLSTYYLDSFQKKEKLFADLQNKAKTIQPKFGSKASSKLRSPSPILPSPNMPATFPCPTSWAVPPLGS